MKYIEKNGNGLRMEDKVIYIQTQLDFVASINEQKFLFENKRPKIIIWKNIYIKKVRQ